MKGSKRTISLESNMTNEPGKKYDDLWSVYADLIIPGEKKKKKAEFHSNIFFLTVHISWLCNYWAKKAVCATSPPFVKITALTFWTSWSRERSPWRIRTETKVLCRAVRDQCAWVERCTAPDIAEPRPQNALKMQQMRTACMGCPSRALEEVLLHSSCTHPLESQRRI